jgi:hypothetical protein
VLNLSPVVNHFSALPLVSISLGSHFDFSGVLGEATIARRLRGRSIVRPTVPYTREPAEFDHTVKSAGTYIGSETTDGRSKQVGDGQPVGVVVVSQMMTSTGDASAAAQTQPTSAPTLWG